ncbi:MAG: hypothetical protein KF906_04555 [Actinobacteria bacterium]|nr:hypothetical protein [Actinomycetota bacterium]
MHSWLIVVAKPGRTVPPHVVELLDDPQPHDLFFPPAAHDRWSSDDGRVQAAGWSVGAWSLRIGSYWDRRPDAATGFSGHVWVGTSAWSERSTWAEQLGDRYRTRPIDEDVERLHGVFTLFHLRADGSGWITADPNGSAMVSRAETDDVVVFGNRVALVSAVTTPPGGQAARDVEAMLMMGAAGALLEDRTGFEAVRLIPSASIVRLRPHEEPVVHQWSRRHWYDEAACADPEAAVQAAIEGLRERARLIASLPTYWPSCELTGGKDSRIVLAMLLGAGVAEEFRFHTWGGPQVPDVQAATALARHYDLTYIADGTTIVEGRSQPRVFGAPHERPLWKVRPLSTEEKLRQNLWMASGSVSLWDRMPVPWPQSPNVSLCGLFGEVMRTTYPKTNSLETVDHLRPFIDEGNFNWNAAGLLTDDAAVHANDLLERLILQEMPESGDLHEAVDGYFQRQRLRRWVGMRQELDGRNRLFPLYDLAAYRAAFAIGSEARRNETLPFRIIETLAPGLARLPFEGKGWPAELLAGLPDGDQYPSQEPRTPWRPPTEARRLARKARQSGSGTPKPRRRGMAAAEARRMAEFDKKRPILRQFLDLPVGHATWDLFDRKRTLAALDDMEYLPTRGRGQVHDAVTVAMWLTHQDEKIDVWVPNPRPAKGRPPG